MQKKKSGSPLILILVLILLVGGVAGLTILSQKNVTVYDAHDHDHDGKPDHGPDVHD